jgi:Sec-independent protein secretion pathway component TatC
MVCTFNNVNTQEAPRVVVKPRRVSFAVLFVLASLFSGFVLVSSVMLTGGVCHLPLLFFFCWFCHRHHSVDKKKKKREKTQEGQENCIFNKCF